MRGLLTLLLVVCWCGASAAHAQPTLDVAANLRGVALGSQVVLLEDPSRRLTLSDVRARADEFRPGQADYLRLGFTESAYWVRVVVKNSSAEPRAWMLEVGYPHLDHVTLYVPRADGTYGKRETGDMLPFAQRDLSYRNFVFMLDEPAQSVRTYYMRVATSGALTLPLSGWTIEEFAEHQHLDWAGLCVFYGVIAVMALYNLSLFAFTRELAYFLFASFVLAMGVFQMTLVGHTFEFLLPNQNALAQLALPVSITVCMLFTALLARSQLDDSVPAARERRILDYLIYGCAGCVPVAALTPFHFSIRFVLAMCGVASALAFVVLLLVMRKERARATLYVWGWGSLLLGAAVNLLVLVDLAPHNFLTAWSAQIGASVQFVLVSAAMATKLVWLRAKLRAANEQLALKVFTLENAVLRAEQATTRAERAMRVKDEFMATMSHELRTPLNTIINVPQGLVEDFPERRLAICSKCHTHFELEPEERVGEETRCPECHSRTLVLHEVATYVGEPARTTRYLETIARSGKHLLQVVNGILRAERADLADAELSYSIVEVGRLVRDVVDELRDWASRTGVTLTLVPLSRELELALDPLRVRQVLLNLISNAIKFSDGRGTVTVTIREDAQRCTLSVQDQGIGIAPDKLDSVFDSYQQAHDSDSRQFGGTGLGLSISRALVQKHGGELGVESQLGQGATFTVRLPRELARRSA